jgi:hypothetical protein
MGTCRSAGVSLPTYFVFPIRKGTHGSQELNSSWYKKTIYIKLLTSDPPLKEAVLGVFDLAGIVAGGSKNKRIDGFCAKFFAKSIAKNRNRLAFVVWEIFLKN